MCGIAGIFAYRSTARAVDREELVRIRDHMTSRGPDGSGEWYSADGRVGLGHRRLSIIDLSPRGAQPMQTADGRLVITFNGEIYNYRALRSKLEAKGYVFRSNSDTEVLLHLYAELGDEMLRELRGMFAFAIWDSREKQLLLARDPYGIKPLYYADDGSTLRFASQVKALMAGRRVSRDPDPAGWVGFYLFGSVPEPFTTYREVRAVPAGSFVRIDRGQLHEPVQYYSIARKYNQAQGNAVSAPTEETKTQVREALLDSVRHHLVADVPVGAFLSVESDSCLGKDLRSLRGEIFQERSGSDARGAPNYSRRDLCYPPATPGHHAPTLHRAEIRSRNNLRWVRRQSLQEPLAPRIDAVRGRSESESQTAGVGARRSSAPFGKAQGNRR